MEERLGILHPGWEPKEGEGPVAEWLKEWVASGFFSEAADGLSCHLPMQCSDVRGAAINAVSSITAHCTVVGDDEHGWRVHLRITPIRAARVMVASKCAVEPGAQGSAWVRLLLTVGATAPDDGYWKRPEHRPDWVAYTDGGCAAGMAGWAWNLLHGGDGEADVDAREVSKGYAGRW